MNNIDNQLFLHFSFYYSNKIINQISYKKKLFIYFYADFENCMKFKFQKIVIANQKKDYGDRLIYTSRSLIQTY